MPVITSSEREATGRVLRLDSVVCGVDGTAASREAVRQAAVLAGPGRCLELVTVTPAPGRPSFLPPPDAAMRVLAEAEAIARRLGIAAASSSIHAAPAAEGLIRDAARADLLVIGCDTLGRVPTAVLRRAPCSLLLTRRPPDLPFCDSILVAAGDDPAPHLTAARLAHEHGSELHAVQPAGIATAAAAIGCGLIVTADDGMAAAIARHASCSVLVVRKPR